MSTDTTLGDIHFELSNLVDRGVHPGSIDWVLHHKVEWPDDEPRDDLCRSNHHGLGIELPATTKPGPEASAALAQLSTVPEVQTALWLVWYFGTGLLDAGVSRSITSAYVKDFAAERGES